MLSVQPAILDTVKVKDKSHRGRLGEFEEHRAAGFGRFITQDELEKQAARKLQDILRQLPGAGIRRTPGGQAWLVSGRGAITITNSRRLDPVDEKRGAGRDCYALVWLDGVLAYGGRDREPLFDLSSFSVGELAGVEFYSGSAQMPPKYLGSNSACGVLVLWTRDH